MIKIELKTWGCACGYRQDFEPTKEAMDAHFNNDKKFPLSNLAESQCPSCVNGSLQVVSDPARKSKLTCFEVGDKAQRENEVILKGPGDIVVGEEYRLEKDKEKEARIESELIEIPDEEKLSIRAELIQGENVMRKFKITRKETEKEFSLRVQKEIEGIVELSSEQIDELKRRFEDK